MSPSEAKKIARAKLIAKHPELAATFALEELKESLAENANKQTDAKMEELRMQILAEKMKSKGDKGDAGYTPLKGVDYFTDEDIEELKEGIKEEVTPVKGVDYVDGVDGKDGHDGKDGRNGIDGDDGVDGKDGSPDTPEQIAEKLNTLEAVVDFKVIKNFELPKAMSVKDLVAEMKKLPLDERLDISDIKNWNQPTRGRLDQRWHGGGSGGGTPGGSTTQVQYNNNGAFGGITGVTSNGTALTAVKLALGSDATGDIYYNSGSGVLARRGIGSTNQVLTVVGGVPTWQNATGAVTSVSNSDGTLTISPTTGDVVASLNLAHANTWTAAQAFNATIKILETGSTPTKYTILQGGDQSIDLTYTLPTAYPAVTGYVLSSTDAGVMSWVAGGGSPAGSGSEVQYRSTATAFGAVTGSSIDANGHIVLNQSVRTQHAITLVGVTGSGDAASSGILNILDKNSNVVFTVDPESMVMNSTNGAVTTSIAQFQSGGSLKWNITTSAIQSGSQNMQITDGLINVGAGAMYIDSTSANGRIQTYNGLQLYPAALGGTGGIEAYGSVTKYKSITTVGWGVPAIYGTGRSTAQTGDVASIATYTVGAADGSFYVSANLNMTAFTAGTMAVTCVYTDETNTSRTLTFSFSNLTGTILNAIGATGPYEGLTMHIRCKASTSITIKSTGTAFTGTYNVEGYITQIG